MSLRFANRTLDELAAVAGATPAYLYDAGTLDERLAALRTHLPPDVRVHYSLKANPMPALVGHLARTVDGLDVASIGELHTALGSGVPAARISFSGPGKREHELVAAVAAGITVHAESFTELARLAAVGARLGRTPRIALRVNPDFDVRRSGMVMGGGSQAFGLDSERVVEAAHTARALGLEVIGLHCYPGSQVLSADTLGALHAATLELLCTLSMEADIESPSLNIGGGFGIPYAARDAELDLAAVGAALEGSVERARERCAPSEIVVETGRYVAGPAGIYLVRIVDRKVSRGKVWLVADGGLNHHLAATGNLGQVIRRNYPVGGVRRDGTSGGDTERTSVVGPLCTPLDVLADDVELPVLGPGDLVAVLQSGAYGYSASPHGFLGHPPPIEVLLHPEAVGPAVDLAVSPVSPAD